MHELIEQSHEPYTITRYVRITSDIVDAQYQMATPAAAEIYGLESPDQLIGAYLSQTLMPQDYMRGVLYAVARHHCMQVNAPLHYITRIIRPDQEIVGVKKHTIQLIGNDGATYWITKLHPIRELDIPKPVTAQQLNLTPQMVYDWAGIASVAEAQRMISNNVGMHHKETNEDRSPKTLPYYRPIYADQLLKSTVEFFSKDGSIRRLRICLKCRYPWFSKEHRPRTCPSCHDNNWDKEYVSGPRIETEVETWTMMISPRTDEKEGSG